MDWVRTDLQFHQGPIHLWFSLALSILYNLLGHSLWQVLNYNSFLSMVNLPNLCYTLQRLSAYSVSILPAQAHNLANVFKGKPTGCPALFWASPLSQESWLPVLNVASLTQWDCPLPRPSPDSHPLALNKESANVPRETVVNLFTILSNLVSWFFLSSLLHQLSYL